MSAPRRKVGEPTPWGKLYQSPAHGSITLGDLAYYAHHQEGSTKLAAAVQRYRMGWR